MITGHKPNGYTVTTDADGRRIEGETRMCIHCQFMWEYAPGSGTVRGFCTNCNGFVCARPECIAEQKRLVDDYLARTGRTRSCMPFEEWNNRIRDKIEKLFPLDPELTVTDSGLVVPRAILGA